MCSVSCFDSLQLFVLISHTGCHVVAIESSVATICACVYSTFWVVPLLPAADVFSSQEKLRRCQELLIVHHTECILHTGTLNESADITVYVCSVYVSGLWSGL